VFTSFVNVYQNQHKFILSHLAYINYKLNMIHVISPDNTKRNIAEFEQKFDDDVVFIYGIFTSY